ncbi:MAG: YkgJ family cysteine cluster protein [Candidatus Thermoplasmatota archaeon]|jgi:Fe-S-cluster containining protein|nr:YkgJ family cysteine cluster protein [Candidatus Thermoplasmatota archaeon]MDP7265850.1 YkgJ family cysteine cluster protein [Candidatus Thermoplasmatota archaeon]
MESHSDERKIESQSRKKVRKKRRYPKKKDSASSNLVFIGGKSFKASTDNENLENIPDDFVLVTSGMRWECLMCGWCCNGNWQINLTWKEYDRLNDVLPIETVVLHELMGASHPYFRINGRCPVHDKENRKCAIYDKKCYTCNAFPFLVTLKRELHICKSCEGFGQGPLIDIDKKIAELLKLKQEAGMNVSIYNNK